MYKICIATKQSRSNCVASKLVIKPNHDRLKKREKTEKESIAKERETKRAGELNSRWLCVFAFEIGHPCKSTPKTFIILFIEIFLFFHWIILWKHFSQQCMRVRTFLWLFRVIFSYYSSLGLLFPTSLALCYSFSVAFLLRLFSHSFAKISSKHWIIFSWV